MARKSDIRLRRSAVSGSVPGGADLNLGELALNTADGAIFVKNGAGNIVTVSHDGILHYDEPNSRIGNGTTDPNRPLHVNGGATDYVARFESSDNNAGIELKDSTSTGAIRTQNGHMIYIADTGDSVGSSSHRWNIDNLSTGEKMRLNAAGELGIGTQSPQAKLDIQNATAGTAASVVAAGTSAGIYLEDDQTPTDNYFVSKVHNTGNDTAIGGIKFAVSPDASNYSWAGIKGLTSTSGNAGNLAFYTSAGNSSGDSSTERMRIDVAGNVGIGTTLPNQKLHVNGSGRFRSAASGLGSFIAVGNETETAGNYSAYYFGNTSNDTGYFKGGIAYETLSTTHGRGDMHFLQRSDTGGGNANISHSVMTILNSGNVGIGTDSPLAKLDVRGDIELNSTYPVIRFKDSDSENDFSIIGGSGLFRIYDEDATASRLSINSLGNVGIGTDSPSTKLEVAGDLTLPSNGQIKFKGTNHYPRIYAASNDLKINLDNGSGSNFEAFRIENTTGAITFNNAYTFPASIGAAGQILKVPATGTDLIWAAESSSEALQLADADGDTKIQVEESTDEDIIRFDVAGSEVAQMTDDGVVLNDGYNFEGDVIGAIKFKAKAGEALTKGDTVYISGISGNTTVVSKADANDAAKMPAFGLAASTVSLNGAVQIVTFGTLQGIDTSSYSEGDELYVNVLAGALTDSPPTGSTSALQKIAKVTRSDASAGSVKVSGAGRTNATPNLDEGKIFVGNASNKSVQGDDTLHVDMANSRVGVNKAAPLDALHVTGVIRTQMDGNNNKHIRLFGGNSGNFLDSYGNTLYIRPSGNTATATTMDASGNIGIGANLTVAGNITATGYLRGPASFVIDPAAHGDDTGTVVIAGNLQVDGTTTTINSTTLDVDDINITVAKGAANATAANGGGLTVDGANATWTYSLGDDAWASNKHAQFYTGGGTGTLSVGRTSNQAIRLYADDNYNRIFAYQDSDTNGDHFFDLVRSFNGTGKADMRFMNGTAVHAVLDKDGNFGINTAAPSNKLEVNGIGCMISGLRLGSSASGEGIIRHGGPTANGIGITTGSLTSPNIKLYVAHGNDGGGVGIGTTAPAAKLHIHQTGSGTLNTIITEDDARKLFIGRDVINCKDLSNNSALLFLNQAGGNVSITNKLGIGTTSPLNNLHVNAGSGGGVTLEANANVDIDFRYRSGGVNKYNVAYDASAGSLIWYDNTANATRMVLDSSGNVGIGTDSPSHLLELSNTMASSPKHIFYRMTGTNAAGGGAGIKFDSSASNNDASLYWSGIQGIRTTSNDGSNELRFWTTSAAEASGAPSQRMVISETGNVGIGTSSPSQTFTVENNSGIFRINTSTSTYPRIEVGSASGTTAAIINRTTATQNIIFGETSDTGNYIFRGGNVGIGTSSPVATLDVNGITKLGNSSYSAGIDTITDGALVVPQGKRIVSQDSAGNNYLRTIFAHDVSTNNYVFGQQGTSLIGDMVFQPGSSGNFRVYASGSEDFRINTSGNVGIGNTDPKAKLSVEEYGIDTTTSSTTATTQVAIHTFPIADFRSARFTIQITNTTDSTYHSTEILAIHDGTTANITEFGEVHTGSSVEATFDADISGANFRLLATPASTNSMTFKVVCHSLTV